MPAARTTRLRRTLTSFFWFYISHVQFGRSMQVFHGRYYLEPHLRYFTQRNPLFETSIPLQVYKPYFWCFAMVSMATPAAPPAFQRICKRLPLLNFMVLFYWYPPGHQSFMFRWFRKRIIFFLFSNFFSKYYFHEFMWIGNFCAAHIFRWRGTFWLFTLWNQRRVLWLYKKRFNSLPLEKKVYFFSWT